MKITRMALKIKTPTRIKPSQVNIILCSSGMPMNSRKLYRSHSDSELGKIASETYGPINPSPAKSRNEELRKRMIIHGIFLRSSPSKKNISFKNCFNELYGFYVYNYAWAKESKFDSKKNKIIWSKFSQEKNILSSELS